MPETLEEVATFLGSAVRDIAGMRDPSGTRILDFGCGSGKLVEALRAMGFDASGCDVSAYWSGTELSNPDALRLITLDPYRLPYESDTFDAVVSTSVFEHAQNKEECFREIHRVLKPGGYSMHLYPGKWYLPSEPHIYVPLLNYFWPRCPRWWLALWAMVGVRNEYQQDQTWRHVVDVNEKYCQRGLSYWSSRRYRDLSMRIFGNCEWPMTYFIEHGRGGFARLFRRLPFKRLSGWISRELRMGFLVQRKTISA